MSSVIVYHTFFTSFFQIYNSIKRVYTNLKCFKIILRFLFKAQQCFKMLQLNCKKIEGMPIMVVGAKIMLYSGARNQI